jgi:hypothetical protein
MFLTFRAVREATVPSNPVYNRQILGSFSRAQAYLWATVGGILHRIASRAGEYSMCKSWQSENQREFNGEVAIHVPGLDSRFSWRGFCRWRLSLQASGARWPLRVVPNDRGEIRGAYVPRRRNAPQP